MSVMRVRRDGGFEDVRARSSFMSDGGLRSDVRSCPLWASFASVIALCLLGGCTSTSPALIDQGQALVVVKTRRLTERFGAFLGRAHHASIDFREDETRQWYRVAVDGPDSGARVYAITDQEAAARDYEGRPYRVLQMLEGDRAIAAIRRLRVEVPAVNRTYAYGPWPGPNSNTFIDDLGRSIPELRFEQHHNAFCKDYAPTVLVGSTTTGTGVELETPVLGVQVGILDGLELHVLALSFGVNLWPPRLELPFVERVGFD